MCVRYTVSMENVREVHCENVREVHRVLVSAVYKSVAGW